MSEGRGHPLRLLPAQTLVPPRPPSGLAAAAHAEEWDGAGTGPGLDRHGASPSLFAAPAAAREAGGTPKPSGLWPGARSFVQRRASRLSTHGAPAEEQ